MNKNKFSEILVVAKWTITGFLFALVCLSIIFLKVHWKGFMKFVTDPYFFDQLEVSRDYQLKK